MKKLINKALSKLFPFKPLPSTQAVMIASAVNTKRRFLTNFELMLK